MSGAQYGPASGLRRIFGTLLIVVLAATSLSSTTPVLAATNVVKATEVDSGKVVVTWTGKTTDLTRLVTYLELPAGKVVQVQSASAGPSIKRVVVQGLTATKSYRFALESGRAGTAPWVRLTLNGSIPSVRGLEGTWAGKDLRISWSPLASLSGASVVVNVSAATGPGKQLATSSSTNSVVFTGLDNKRTYTARAVVKTSTGSGTARSVSIAPALPGSPTLRASSPRVGVVMLEWKTAGANAEQWLISVRSQGNNRDGNIIPVIGSQTKLEVDELTSGATYSFRVTGRNTLGDGAASTAVGVVVASDITPPSELVLAPGDRSVTVKWTPGRVPTGIATYRVAYRTSVGVSWQYSESTTSPTASVTGLSNNTNYIFAVEISAGDGRKVLSTTARSTPVSGKDVSPIPTPTPTKPAVPTSRVTAFVVLAGTSEVTLSWSDPDKTNLTIQWRDEANAVWQELVASTSPQKISGLTNGTKYSFRLLRGSDLVVVTPTLSATPKGVAGPVTTLTATPGHSEALVSWQPPLSDGGYTIEAYVISYAGPGVNREVTCGNSCRSISATGLENGSTYQISVYGITSRGAGVISTVSVVPSA